MALISAVRPAEWLKNAFVLAPLMFSGHVDDVNTTLRGLTTFVAMCLVASTGYLVNDLKDVELDRKHSTKRTRAIASGDLPESTARVAGVLMTIAAFGLSLAVGWDVLGVVAGYGALTVAYTLGLKHVVIIDVMTIAGCFLLRVLAGAVAINVTASSWLIVCTGMIALFLGFTKRRQEAMGELKSGTETRPVLEHYSLPFLDQMVSMVTAGTVISYAIYAQDSPLVGDRMLITTPIVMHGIFRYLYLIYHRQDTRSTSTLLTGDPGLIATMGAFVAAAVLIIYI
jgi:4-hydroxybenzoate polyprenyltransferase